MVAAPFLASVLYLGLIANDQYASVVGFSVRSEDVGSAQSLLGGLSMLTKASSTDTDVLYEFIQSQTLVERIQKKLDLVKMFTRPSFDPVFAYDDEGNIEDLVAYWQRMVTVSYAAGGGLIEVEARAFTPEDAHALTVAIVAESSSMINDMSTAAREDATRYAREELKLAVERLKTARGELTKFRSKTRIVDPSADIQGQMGLLNSLEARLADSFIDLNLLLESTNDKDPRVAQARRRIDVIEVLIEQERMKFGIGEGTLPDQADGSENSDYPTLVGEFEKLSVEVEYASKSYLAALAALDGATAEAQRQSRYLSTYSTPTLPQKSIYPQRGVLTLVIGLFLLLFWGIAVLVYYSLKDRR